MLVAPKCAELHPTLQCVVRSLLLLVRLSLPILGSPHCSMHSRSLSPGGARIRHLEPGLHSVPDGVRPHALQVGIRAGGEGSHGGGVEGSCGVLEGPASGDFPTSCPHTGLPLCVQSTLHPPTPEECHRFSPCCPPPSCSHLPFIQKMHAIIDAGHRIAFPPLKNAALLDVIERCLDRNPRSRITMQVGEWGPG